MPNQDKTGPLGQGAMTGRGLGPCGAGLRRGFGRGTGRFSGRCWRAYPDQTVTLTKEQEKKVLDTELADIESEKIEIEKRLKELKK